MIDWEPYLNSIGESYWQWWESYTSTDAVALEPNRRDEAEKPGAKEAQVERYAVVEGLRKYAGEGVLLVGRPGSGKSTSLKRLLFEEAQLARTDSGRAIPVLIELRSCKEGVVKSIARFLRTHDLRLEDSDISHIQSQLFIFFHKGQLKNGKQL